MRHDDREHGSRNHLDAHAPAAQRSAAPGKRTLTERLSRGGHRSTPVQARRDPAAEAAREAQAADAQRWLDVAVRPDLDVLDAADGPVQRKDGEGAASSPPSPGGSGLPMPGGVRAKMEHALGADFSAVRIHEGSQATTLGALAYTQGTNIHFAPGQYRPDSQSGQELLGHELAHVVQQSEGRVQATTQAQGVDINDNHSLEREADEMGSRAARGQTTGGRAVGPASAAAGPAQRAVAQRAAKSDYKDDAALTGMTLRELDQHAHAQADWASSTALTGAIRDKLRALLAFARKTEGLVLGSCGDFPVSDLLAWGAGTGGPVDENLLHYSRAASVNKATPTVNIEAPAATVEQASSWGEALGKLLAAPGLGGLVIQKVIKQHSGRQNLKDLVDKGAVDDFIAYVALVKPNLDADTGREIVSYLAFRDEGCNAATYKAQIPTIRNLHRFSKADLDGLVTNQAAPKGDFPLTIIIQSGFDHNGAFHRDPNLTAVITRANNVTLVLEGESSLAAFSSQLEPLAKKYKNDGKIDQVMINGHGNAKLMESAGENGTGTTSSGDTVYGRTRNEPLTVDQRHPKPLRDKTDAFFKELIKNMKDDPASRIVLNACLTASNSVDTPLRTDTPEHTQEDIRNAIAANPSLATALDKKATDMGKGNIDVRGSNASFGQIGLLDGSDKIDLISARDPKLTASKLEYAKEGTEPTGALRAALEAWGTNRKDAIDAIKWRLANRTGLDWSEVVIRSLYKVIVTEPDNGALINELTTAASALGHLPNKAECTVAGLRGKVPATRMNAVFTELETATIWPMADFQYMPAVVYQVWMAQDGAKKAKLIQHLTGSTLTTQSAASCIDLGHVTPLLDGTLLPTPAPSPAPRGPTLLALLFLVRQGAGAPAAAKQYLVSVAAGGQSFPASAGIAAILKGATERDVLEDAGIVKPSPPVATTTTTTSASAPENNLAPRHEADNQLLVESVTLRGTASSAVDALDAPGGAKQGTIAKGTKLHIIGKAKGTKKRTILPDIPNTEYFAVEHSMGGFFTVFVEASSIAVSP